MINLDKLQSLEIINQPKSRLEQYFTPPEISLKFLSKINFENKVIADLGCGNGILGLTALLLGAKKVYFFDTDETSVAVAKRNFEKLNSELKLGEALFFNKDISLIKKSGFQDIDICISNPPFGTIKDSKKIDTVFLKKAMKLANSIVSMHKTSSKEFIKRIILGNNFKINYLNDFLFPIPRSYPHHTEEIKDVKVTLFIAEKDNL